MEEGILSSSQKFLLSIHACFGLATTMSGLFLNLYLWRLSNDLTVNASFMLVSFFFGLLSFAYGALLSKKKDRIFSYQIGIGLTALFYLLVILLQEQTASFPMLIGILHGTAAGFYWVGYLVLIYDLVDNQSRSIFMGKQNAVFGVVNTVGPAFAGYIISKLEFTGYNLVFTLSLLLFLSGLLLSFRLPKDLSPKKPLYLRLLWRLNRRKRTLKPMWFGWFIWGMCEGLLGFFPTLILFMTVDNEFLVGISSILFGSVAILSSLWHAKYNHQNREPSTILVVWLLYFISCVPMILYMNVWTVFIFLIVNEMSKALIGVSYFSFMFRTIHDLPKSGLRTESMVMRETMLNAGRIVSVITFIILYQFSQELTYYYFLFAVFIQGFLFKIISMERNEALLFRQSSKD
jgi:MFS transporter, YQGE family, putative transporter